MKKYRVWFSQINQCHIDIKAETEEEAIEKAHKTWCKDYGRPYVEYVEKIDQTEQKLNFEKWWERKLKYIKEK